MNGMKKYVVVLLALSATSVATAGINRSLDWTNMNTLAANDDSYVGPVAIGFTLDFFGASHSQLYVNNNGNVTFNGGLYNYTPWGISGGSIPMIAPFFADVDTRGAASAVLTYGQTTMAGRSAFVANWWDASHGGVGYYSYGTDRLNEFQLILRDRSDIATGDFDIYFNYDKIQWETGDASDGSGGLGGTSAVVGYTNGAGDYLEFDGSHVNGAFLDGGVNSLASHTNIGVLGSYLMQVRNGAVVVPPTEPVPVPGAMLLGMLGLSVAGAKLRKRI